MNGEIPSVPITTLAGVASLTDLLPGLPLPSPLPSSVGNKSLLFHPRVAEEARRLLNLRDEPLANQLIHALSQTSTDHIELKDNYSGSNCLEGEIPELLKAILQRNPQTLKGVSIQGANLRHQMPPTATSAVPFYSHSSNYTQHSPYPSPHLSPYSCQPSPSRYTPQGSPARYPPQGSPAMDTKIQNTAVTTHVNGSAPMPVPPLPPPPLALDILTPKQEPLSPMPPARAKSQGNSSPAQSVAAAPVFNQMQQQHAAPPPPLQQPLSQHHHLQQQHPVVQQAAPAAPQAPMPVVAVVPLHQQQQQQQLPPPSPAVAASPQPQQLSGVVIGGVPQPITRRKSSLNEPVVVLKMLTKEEQMLAQRSVRQFSLKGPTPAVPSGASIAGNCTSRSGPRSRRQSTSSDRSGLPKTRSSSGSDSSEDEPLAEKKKRDESMKDASRLKSGKPPAKKQRLNDNSFDNRLGQSAVSLTERVKQRRKRGGAQSAYVDSAEEEENDQAAYSSRVRDETPSPESSAEAMQRQKIKKEKNRKKMSLPEENLTPDELMETNTFKRFTNALDLIFESSEDLDLTAELDEDAEVPQEALIPKYQLAELCGEAAKLKAIGAMQQIPADRLVRLLNVLERNIRDGAKLLPIHNPDEHDEEEGKLWLELTMERVTRSIDASLTAIYIMTSRNMPKQVYLEDVIERVVMFVKYQLQNTIFPVFDPVYRVNSRSKDAYVGNIKQKRARAKEVKHRTVLQLYNKLHELVTLMAELLDVQVVTDTTVLQVSTLGVSPFFVENVSELQLSALRLVTTVFAKYDKHRQLILEDILASLARLPTSKRSLRNFRLNSEEQIQMVTALILQLIQCVVQLPKMEDDAPPVANQLSSSPDKKSKAKVEAEPKKDDKSEVDRDVFIIGSYETSMRTALNFLSVFLKKCSSKTEELDYRPLFENFVQDLLTTVNKPEWPAAELLLSLLGRLLVQNFSNKSLDMSLRVASLDYLGAVAARLRKDSVTSLLKKDTIDEMVRHLSSEDDDQIRNSKNKKAKAPEPLDRSQVLQKALLDYLCSNLQSDPALLFAKQFYVAQWYRDANKEAIQDQKRELHGKATPVKKEQPASHHNRNYGGGAGRTPTKASKGVKKKRKRKMDSSSDEAEEEEEEDDPNDSSDDDAPLRPPSGHQLDGAPLGAAAALRLAERRKKFLLSTIRTNAAFAANTMMSNSKQSKIDYQSAELIARFLASRRPFSQSFDIYLSQILRVLNESAIAVRTKAMKCLAMVVEADPGILAREDMKRGVHGRFLDQSTSVREAAVDLVGKFILIRPELTNQYYTMLIERILDTGVSVRKRVIKILKDVCIEQPEFTKIPEICVKMIRRVNDEEGIKKLVNEVFQNMWFSPVKDKDIKTLLLRKVMNITDVVAACKDSGLDWFEQLLQNLLKQKQEKEDAATFRYAVLACRQVVNCLVENVLQLEENALGENGEGQVTNHQRLVACLTTLHLFAKIKPDLLVPHATTLQPYLTLKCSTQGDYLVLSNVARTLELVVPLMEHPSETFLAQLEENMIKLILRHGMMVVQSCLSCLGAVVNDVTHNYKLVKDCFHKFFVVLQKLKAEHEQNPNNPALLQHHPTLRRSLFTVGLFSRYFDFDANDPPGPLQPTVKEKLFDGLLYFMRHQDEEVKHMALTGLGSMCIRYYELMLGRDVKTIYNALLTNESASVPLKCQILKNIQTYLQEEESRMIKQDSQWSKTCKKEDLKEMGDVTSGMASTVIQIYLKQILEAYLHYSSQVRNCVLGVIQLILAQGLVHPVQIVPYLICMSTDDEQTVRTKSDQQLQEIEKKYPGFIQMKAIAGVKMSFRLQKIILQGSAEAVRGFRPPPQGETPSSKNGFLYAVVRGSRQHRRAFILCLLKQFDEQLKTPLDELLYLADNMAYFPYQLQDEPLFLIHHIDVFISVTGSNLLQSFREMTSPPKPSDPVPETVCETAAGEPSGDAGVSQDRREETESAMALGGGGGGGGGSPPRKSQGGKSDVVDCPPARKQSVSGGASGVALGQQGVKGPVVMLENISLRFGPAAKALDSSLAHKMNVIQGLIPPAAREVNSVLPEQPPLSKVAIALDDEEDEDLETILGRLPEDTVPLQDCMAASQGCLLLLVLKQHLKDMYGFTDGKIHHYSPAEAGKTFEKAVNRKHVSLFKPNLNELVRQGVSPVELDEDGRANLVQQYLEFKELMLSIDQADEDDDDDLPPGAAGRSPGQAKSPHAAGLPPPPGGVPNADVKLEGGALPPGHQTVVVTMPPANTTITQHKDVQEMTERQRHPGATAAVTNATLAAKKKYNFSSSEVSKSKIKVRTPSKPKEKPKKKVKKKRRRVIDSGDESSEASDPDYMG